MKICWYIENTSINAPCKISIAVSPKRTLELPNHYSRILKMFTVNNKCHPNNTVHILGSLYLRVTSDCLLFRTRVHCPYCPVPTPHRAAVIHTRFQSLLQQVFVSMFLGRSERKRIFAVGTGCSCMQVFREQTNEFPDKISRSVIQN